ncbi:hypothetical protein HOY80DRAFT_1012256 [Tuber brumale]|nr:hypothetical protein HOY80DRAFT_1012256 [Tuber brumale]
MSLSRSLPRNVLFYDARNPGEAVGGLVQNGSITEANFLDILGILLVVDGHSVLVVERISLHIVSGMDTPLQAGAYGIYCDERFRHEIRNRDRKCVLSGVTNTEILIEANNWVAFQAAHIFPVEHESLWIRFNYGRWITDTDDTRSSKINSCQNWFLLDATMHLKFDQYLVSVNPDDNYKIVVFDPDIRGLDGRILDPVCRNPADPYRVSDQLLRWHFRQSVLANMRGAGERIFTHDSPPDIDMAGGPEMHVAARLGEVSQREPLWDLEEFAA